MVANFVVAGEDNEGLEEELREAFRLYDKEGNGYINVSDLREILRALDDNVSEDVSLDSMTLSPILDSLKIGLNIIFRSSMR
jgi:Ca2+-binding EF-hand superfamily protein